MAGTEAFRLKPPTAEDLKVVKHAWEEGVSRYTLRTDDSWWRVLRAKDKTEALRFARELYPSSALSRFAPITHGGNIVAAAYAGSTMKVALWEIILRGIRHSGIRRVPEHEVKDRYLIQVQPVKALTLLDVRRPRDANLVPEGARPPDLTQAWSSAYHLTRAWAQGLRDTIPGLQGIVYESHHVDGDCVVLYATDELVLFEDVGPPQRMVDSPVRELLITEARKAGAGVDFGIDDDDLI